MATNDIQQGCPTFFNLRSTFQVAILPRSTSPVSTLQTHTHRFQPAVTNLTTLFLVVTQLLDITTQTLPLSNTHTHRQIPLTQLPVCIVHYSTNPLSLLLSLSHTHTHMPICMMSNSHN